MDPDESARACPRTELAVERGQVAEGDLLQCGHAGPVLLVDEAVEGGRVGHRLGGRDAQQPLDAGTDVEEPPAALRVAQDLVDGPQRQVVTDGP